MRRGETPPWGVARFSAEESGTSRIFGAFSFFFSFFLSDGKVIVVRIMYLSGFDRFCFDRYSLLFFLFHDGLFLRREILKAGEVIWNLEGGLVVMVW